MQVDSIGGDKVIDNFSRKLWPCLIKRKNEVLGMFKRFESMVERQSGHKIKTFMTNSGDEYVYDFLYIL